MNDVRQVGTGQCTRDVGRDVEHRFERQPTGTQSLLEALALKQFHRDERETVGFTDIENRADVRVVQGRGEPRFTGEAAHRHVIPEH
jgi:hypothetical protein